MARFRDGGTPSTKVGAVNKHEQQCLGHRGAYRVRPGPDYYQKVYKMECLLCGHKYGTRGNHIPLCRCPKCQDGRVGLKY